ncbi:alcohol dehydrogenase catalytic domain-containing protein [candidate division KSB1 bacterium]|nr:alcohol dehydrogenase catalytic domain-containing protein [candidate division KSB1 bacterium]
MKAAIIEKINTLRVKDIPEPPVGEYDAFCDILYGAVCTGTDQHLIDGTCPFLSPLPAVLGHESIGQVVEIGRKVRYLKPGDLVTRVGTVPVDGYSVSWGGFAEKGIASDWRAMQEDGIPRDNWEESRRNIVLPGDIDPAAATMIVTWRETMSYITRMGIGKDARVLVIGSGGNGLSFVAHAANLGAAQIAMIGALNREPHARRAGATHYFDYRNQNIFQTVEKTCGSLFDFAIDAVGKIGLADLGLRLLKANGTIGIYGIDDYGKCILNPQHARGSFEFYNNGYDEPEVHERVVALMQSGKLDASIWLNLENPFPLENINEAFEALRARQAVKALIKVKQ